MVSNSPRCHTLLYVRQNGESVFSFSFVFCTLCVVRNGTFFPHGKFVCMLTAASPWGRGGLLECGSDTLCVVTNFSLYGGVTVKRSTSVALRIMCQCKATTHPTRPRSLVELCGYSDSPRCRTLLYVRQKRSLVCLTLLRFVFCTLCCPKWEFLPWEIRVLALTLTVWL